ncbi:hypothetical protein FZI95_09730 [Mycobacterium sp. CBMA247]|nr:hypothetical protein [Mycolicibacterium sp. CBMA 329]MUL87818.1 hypothetical protein [Mycolicibacterium sp. CBMA 331]MUM01642.1 hypothetical protein [Mycolicibacterium sp. CBMA 334]MUM25526.1 hypothetical protein [Mycolicibacterium sp. CBMA 295]MUM38115.1 hypothetical protein [Mycolicibacterium sp. CBMA 247]MUM43883.1 hypothetical protein [Mycolicibacterium sp. CBMA 294]
MAQTTSNTGVKTLAAILGGSAVVAMGVIGATLSGGHDGPMTVITGEKMTIGETTTVTYAPSIAPAVAAPAVKAPPYGKH